jgi:hypothetical protein
MLPSWQNVALLGPASKVLAPPRIPELEAIAHRSPFARLRESGAELVALAHARRMGLMAVAVVAVGGIASWTLLPVGNAPQKSTVPAAAIAAPIAESRTERAAVRPETLDRTTPPPTTAAIPSTIAIWPVNVAASSQASSTKNQAMTTKTSRPTAETQAPPALLPRTSAPAQPPPERPPPAATMQAPAPASPAAPEVEVAAEFDRGAAMQALRQAGDTAKSCPLGANVSEAPRVAVTFARSGSVSDVVVEGPLANPVASSCIVGKFRGLRVPPFRGSSVTVRKTITF